MLDLLNALPSLFPLTEQQASKLLTTLLYKLKSFSSESDLSQCLDVLYPLLQTSSFSANSLIEVLSVLSSIPNSSLCLAPISLATSQLDPTCIPSELTSYLLNLAIKHVPSDHSLLILTSFSSHIPSSTLSPIISHSIPHLHCSPSNVCSILKLVYDLSPSCVLSNSSVVKGVVAQLDELEFREEPLLMKFFCCLVKDAILVDKCSVKEETVFNLLNQSIKGLIVESSVLGVELAQIFQPDLFIDTLNLLLTNFQHFDKASQLCWLDCIKFLVEKTNRNAIAELLSESVEFLNILVEFLYKEPSVLVTVLSILKQVCYFPLTLEISQEIFKFLAPHLPISKGEELNILCFEIVLRLSCSNISQGQRGDHYQLVDDVIVRAAQNFKILNANTRNVDDILVVNQNLNSENRVLKSKLEENQSKLKNSLHEIADLKSELSRLSDKANILEQHVTDLQSIKKQLTDDVDRLTIRENELFTKNSTLCQDLNSIRVENSELLEENKLLKKERPLLGDLSILIRGLAEFCGTELPETNQKSHEKSEKVLDNGIVKPIPLE
ncbi:hypothetical protein P9112_012200 [Eukaryota sp. TZLM1-RC]